MARPAVALRQRYPYGPPMPCTAGSSSYLSPQTIPKVCLRGILKSSKADENTGGKARIGKSTFANLPDRWERGQISCSILCRTRCALSRVGIREGSFQGRCASEDFSAFKSIPADVVAVLEKCNYPIRNAVLIQHLRGGGHRTTRWASDGY